MMSAWFVSCSVSWSFKKGSSRHWLAFSETATYSASQPEWNTQIEKIFLVCFISYIVMCKQSADQFSSRVFPPKFPELAWLSLGSSLFSLSIPSTVLEISGESSILKSKNDKNVWSNIHVNPKLKSVKLIKVSLFELKTKKQTNW